MNAALVSQSPVHGLIRPVRPAKEWFALSQAHGVALPPSQVVDLLMACLQAIHGYGSPLRLEAIWMSPRGEVELVFPARSTCTSEVCLFSLGVLACEALSGEATGQAHPGMSLARARLKVMATCPQEWNGPFEAALARMIGLGETFSGVEEALFAFGHLAGAPWSHPLMALPWHPATSQGVSCTPPPRPGHWLIPAAAGFALSMALMLGAGIAYQMGARHGVERANHPIAIPAPAPIPPVTVEDKRLVIDPASMNALAAALKAANRQRPAPAPPAAVPPKVSEEGPVFVEGPAEPAKPLGARRDPNRVTSNDFVARTR